MKILLTLLTSNCITRLVRLVDNVNHILPEKGVDLVPIVVVNTLNDDYYQQVLKLNLPFPVIRTESNGKPGRGKNSCLELFLESDCDFVSQIDGDDILYPTYLKSLARHIKHYPSLDVLGAIPTDYITKGKTKSGYVFKINEEVVASVWGISVTAPWTGAECGPGVSHIFHEDMPNSVDFIILQSRKSAEIKMREDIMIAEDHVYSYQLLAEHQKGNIQYFHTMSSDLYVIDKTTENSLQKVHSQNTELLRKYALEYVHMNRSSTYELPVIYNDLMINQMEKERWLKTFLSTTP